MLDHPLSPGESSAVERGPWHYGADYVSVYFRAEMEKLRNLVPPPFAIADGRCSAYVCEIVSVNESDPAMVGRQPDRTLYHEAAVGVKCTFNGKPGVFYPVMWVSTEWALLRGLLNGYQKRLADKIALTKLHPLNPGLEPVGPGTEFAGFCVKGSERMLSLKVRVTHKGDPSDIPSFGATFGRRVFPRTDATQATVGEAVEVLKSNSRISDVWVGEGSVDSVLGLGAAKVDLGASFRSGFTISGSRVLMKDSNP